MRQALSELTLEGLHTNVTLHQQIMDHVDFQAGHVATDFLTKAFTTT